MGQVALVLAITFVVALFLRIPIAYALGISAFVTMVFAQGLGTDYLVQTLFNANNSFTLLAVPFFILAGDLMLSAGVSDRLVNLIRVFFGRVPGSMAVVTVIACMIFAAISGSGPATVAAMGGIMIPVLMEEGYDTPFACSITSAAGSLGPVIPPSVIFVMYGVTVGTSIGKLFIGGIIPGVLIGLVLIAYSVYMAKKHHWGLKSAKPTKAEIGKALKEGIWAVLVPVIILGGIYSGIFTPTEAAVIACVYAIIIGFLVYRELNIMKMFNTFKRSAITLGAAIIIVPFATAFGRVITIAQIPQMLAKWMTTVLGNKFVFLLVINVFLFFVGMFMETLSAVLILAPLLVPVAAAFGISDIQFGVVMTINLAMGLCTPPVGVNTYVASALGGIKVDQMIKPLIPIVAIMFVTIIIISFVPVLSLGLTMLMK